MVRICCPFCGNQKYKLFVYADRSNFHCFRCWENGIIYRLFKKLGIDYKRGEEPRSAKFLAARRKAPLRAVELPPGAMKLSPTDRSYLAQRAASYLLVHRGLDWEEIERYDIHFCPSGALAGNIVFPIRDQTGHTVSWQAKRYWLAGGKNKNPSEGPGKSELLYNIDQCVGRDLVVIVEGPFDAIAIHRLIEDSGFGSVAIFGHKISKLQALSVSRIVKPLWAYVMFDPDAVHEQSAAAEQLKKAGIDEIMLCNLTKGDPDELSADELGEVLCNAKSYRCV